MNNKSYERVQVETHHLLFWCNDLHIIDNKLRRLAEIVGDEDHPQRRERPLDKWLEDIDEAHKKREFCLSCISSKLAHLHKELDNGINETII